MSNTSLPKQVDVRKLIAADVSIEAREPLANFARLADMLEADAGDVEIQLHFFSDEHGVKRIDGEVQATLTVLCQRCLQPLALPVQSQFHAAAVWSDEEAARLPKELEPYIVGEEPQDIRDLIEDELIISVPYVSYHDEGSCVADGYATLAEIVEPQSIEPTEAKENPFKVLQQLKEPSKK